MSLISQAIPNLFNGVSQQPATLRHTSQCAALENGYPEIAVGLRKRPPTQHMAKLRAALGTPNAFVHFINRDSATRYVLVCHTNTAEIFRLSDGAAVSLSTPSGSAYLASTNPREDFAAVTIADYTFLVNRTFTPVMDVATVAGSLTGTVQEFSSLPAAASSSGQIYKVQGDDSNEFAVYYVKSDGTVWVETAAPGETYKFDATTMPHQFVNTGALTFTFDKATWEDRLVGDRATTPDPSFIGTPILDVFYYRNRLGFLADEYVILGRPGAAFNFWPKTATAVLDTDPIDVGATSSRVALLKWAVPFSKELFLFSDQEQFQLTGGEILTPKTAKITPVTSFECSTKVRPVALGRDLHFVVPRGAYSGIREYFVDSDTINNSGTEITAHVPSYVPSNVAVLAGSPAHDFLVCASSDSKNVLYGYKYYWGDQSKLQSAWFKFATLPSGDSILGAGFIESLLYLVIGRADGVYLEKVDLTPTAADATLGIDVLLDRRQYAAATGTYDSGNDWTTWSLGFADTEDFQVVVASGDAIGETFDAVRPSSSQVRIAGDYSARNVYFGRPYTMSFVFSEIHYRDGKDRALLAADIRLRRMKVAFVDTSMFDVAVTPKGRAAYRQTYTANVVGSVEWQVGSPSVASGSYSFPVSTKNIGATIELSNPYPFPSIFQSADWSGEVTTKSAPR